MTLCPIALAVGCQKCPVFKVCPVKTVIGDYHPPEPKPTAVETIGREIARQARALIAPSSGNGTAPRDCP